MSGREIHSGGTIVLSTLMAIIGVGLVVETVRAGGSVLSGRLLLGVLFILAGAGRLYVETRRRRGASSR